MKTTLSTDMNNSFEYLDTKVIIKTISFLPCVCVGVTLVRYLLYLFRFVVVKLKNIKCFN